MSNYLEAAAFTRLFRQPRRNFQKISEGLFLISRNTAKKIDFPSVHERDDAVQSVTLKAILAIRKFDTNRGTTAFAYFTRLVIREMTRTNGVVQRESEKRRRMRYLGHALVRAVNCNKRFYTRKWAMHD